MINTQEICKAIESTENKARKQGSYLEWNVYNSKIYQHVFDYLKNRYGQKTARSMPIIACMNICKRIVNAKASLYRREPIREFEGCTDDQKKALKEIYQDMGVNQALKRANRYYKLQGQSTLQVIPNGEDIELRVIKNHNIDVVPNKANNELADAYVTSTLNSMLLNTSPSNASVPNQSLALVRDGVNQSISDKDDYLSTEKVRIFWTKQENFKTDEKGGLLSEVNPNPIGELPFIDIAEEKDESFWVMTGNPLVDFTVQFNASLSSNQQVVDLQGFAVGWIKAGKDYVTNELIVGPAKIVHLPPDENGTYAEIGFTNPQADLEGVRKHLDSLIAIYLSTEGLDTKMISSSGATQSYSSALERLLATLDNFEASEDDVSVMRTVEHELFELIKKWINVAQSSNLLGDKYSIGTIPEEARVSVKFAKPDMVQTDAEKVDAIIKRKSNGLLTPVEAIAKDREISIEEAQIIADEMEDDKPEVEPVIYPVQKDKVIPVSDKTDYKKMYEDKLKEQSVKDE